MARVKKEEVKDYQQPFEFRLTEGDNLICRRYFQIWDWNPNCRTSEELMDTMRWFTQVIDRDLKDKTQTYMEIVSPQYFKDEDEMYRFFANPENRKFIRRGCGIVVRSNPDHDYVWVEKVDKRGNVIEEGHCAALETKIDDSGLGVNLEDDDRVTYTLSFLKDGKEVCTTNWVGIYPKFIRYTIDLTNKWSGGEQKLNDVNPYTIGFDGYLAYKLYSGKEDLNYKIIRSLQRLCSQEDKWYTMLEA